ncbi:MAG: hypothetical protein SV760_01220, partial [Halobacteria archaeon]|nr:hypothetical protein [Halobacteria archaeon]
MTSSSPTVPEAEEIGSLEEVSPDSTEGVVELLRVNDIASLGRVAYKKKRQVSGERIFYGSLNEYPEDAGYEDGELVEVSTESVREAGDEPSEVVDSIGSSG